ncbi:MAG: DUF4382 domain-containing protein [Armatimonadia bacterium]|nr:DUF4382 domain-containing protein [Armatimonadia bacterium]
MTSSRTRWLALVGICALATAAIVGCATGPGTDLGSNEGTTSATGTGTLRLALTDAPSLDYESVVLTIVEVWAISAETEGDDGDETGDDPADDPADDGEEGDGEGDGVVAEQEEGADDGDGSGDETGDDPADDPADDGEEGDEDEGKVLIADFTAEPMVIDVMQLQWDEGVAKTLGVAEAPQGDYNQVRLVLAANDDPGKLANYYTLASDEADENGEKLKYAIKTPSAQQSGLKINGKFTLGNEEKNVVIDFDPEWAIVVTGNGGAIFKPTGIRLIETESYEEPVDDGDGTDDGADDDSGDGNDSGAGDGEGDGGGAGESTV